MALKKRITISWSGGKDSAFALYKILLANEYDIVHLHTMIGAETRRVGLHGVHESLIEAQAAALNLPLVKLLLPESEHNDPYERVMKAFYGRCVEEKIVAIMFGDIFLEDLKAYREKLLLAYRIEPLFPLWKIDTGLLISDFIHIGFKTVVCAAQAKWFDEQFPGETIDENLVRSFPEGVDRCGENGEFHTFVFDGPIFKNPIAIRNGKRVTKEYVFHTQEDGVVHEVKTSVHFIDLQLAWQAPAQMR